MHVVFYTSPKVRRVAVAECFASGVRRHDDTIELVPIGQPSTRHPDVTAIIGNKHRHHVKDDAPMLVLDKSYPHPKNPARWIFLRGPPDHLRVSINDSHPVSFLTKLNMPSDRRIRFGWDPEEWRHPGDHVLVAGSSRVYYAYKGLGSNRHIALFDEVRGLTKRKVLLRLKPNMTEDEDRIPLSDHLAGCHVMVVENSMVAFEALLSGIPTVVLADAPTGPISSRSLREIERPYLAPLLQRYSLLNDLAYFQYSHEEYARGDAWDFLRPLLLKGMSHVAT